MPPHTPIAIANNVLDIAGQHDEQLSPMKLQKLVFFSHGWHLGFNHGPLSSEEAEAWQWGPVFPSLYHAVKTWGSGSILEPITRTIFPPRRPGQRRAPTVTTPTIPDDDGFALGLLERTWEVYGGMTALQLSALSHEEGGPWDQAYGDGQTRSVVIPNESIAKFYSARAAANAGR